MGGRKGGRLEESKIRLTSLAVTGAELGKTAVYRGHYVLPAMAKGSARILFGPTILSNLKETINKLGLSCV